PGGPGRGGEVDRRAAVPGRAARDPVTRQGPTPPAAHERTGRAERLAKVIRHRDLVAALLGPSDDRAEELLGLPNDWLLDELGAGDYGVDALKHRRPDALQRGQQPVLQCGGASRGVVSEREALLDRVPRRPVRPAADTEPLVERVDVLAAKRLGRLRVQDRL